MTWEQARSFCTQLAPQAKSKLAAASNYEKDAAIKSMRSESMKF